MTRVGRYWLGITTLLAAIGLVKNINLLILLAYSLLVIFCLNVLSARRQVRQLWARRQLPDLVFARSPFSLVISLGSDRGNKAALRVEETGPDITMQWFVPWLARAQTKTLRAEVVLPERGPCELSPLLVGSSHPFGLFERRCAAGEPAQLLVLPALGWLNRGRFLHWLRHADFEEEEMRRPPRRSPIAQAEFHGLRPFRAGDSPRLIHWRTSARRGELMTREYEDTPGQNLIVVLDATGGERLDASFLSSFEKAVSLAATICHEWCRRRGDRLIAAIAGSDPLVLDGFSGPDHARRILEALAVVRPSAACDRAALLAGFSSAWRVSASLVVVSMGPTSLGEWLGARLHRSAVNLDVLEIERYEFYEPIQ